MSLPSSFQQKHSKKGQMSTALDLSTTIISHTLPLKQGIDGRMRVCVLLTTFYSKETRTWVMDRLRSSKKSMT
jgi:hypothetical protein